MPANQRFLALSDAELLLLIKEDPDHFSIVFKKTRDYCYLYRDAGNYKDFGELIFSNPSGWSPEAASERLRAQLIDGEYFYPKEWGVPLICGEAWLDNWYEFVEFSASEEKPTDVRTAEDFLEGVENKTSKVKHLI